MQKSGFLTSRLIYQGFLYFKFIHCSSLFSVQVFKTDMFKKFLEERMSETSDYWSDLEMKTRRDIDSYTLSRRYFKKLRYYVNIYVLCCDFYGHRN